LQQLDEKPVYFHLVKTNKTLMLYSTIAHTITKVIITACLNIYSLT